MPSAFLSSFCKRRSSHSWTRPRFCKAPSPRRRNAAFPPVKTACTKHSPASPTAVHSLTPSPRAAASRKPEKLSPPKHCCEERDEDKCPQLHSCVSYEHRVCRDRTGQANPSATQQQTKTPVVLSVVDLSCGLSRLSKRGESDRRGCICLTARERPPAAPS